MSNATLGLSEAIQHYLQSAVLREAPVLKRLRDETAKLGNAANMQIAPEQGQFMALLIELLGVKRYLEVGTFTGYSALACALAMPDDGQVIACDVSTDWTDMARRFWQEAGVSNKIDLRIAPASDTLDNLLNDDQAQTFDLMFIDADKKGYDGYYEQGLKLVRSGGLILLDNMLWGGDVVNSNPDDDRTIALQKLTEKITADERVSMSLVPIADGLIMARKR